jgi:restriction system protein
VAQNNPTNVNAAFEMLLEEVEAEIATINTAGGNAFQAGDYSKAQDLLLRAGQVTAFRDKVAALRKEWEVLMPAPAAAAQPAGSGLSRLQRGLRTPEEVFYQPILRALAKLGGSAKMGDVLANVEQQMKGMLKSVDDEPLTSDPDTLRWRNTAQWARHAMVQEGLLKSGSPKGTWEISDKGRAAIQ